MTATAAAASLAMAAAPVLAFDTSSHTDITVDALRAEGFSQSAADIVRLENWLVDLYSQEKKVPQSGHTGVLERLAGAVVFAENWSKTLVESVHRLHFDHLNEAQVEAEWDRLRRATWVHARSAVQDRKPLDLLTILGISLHAVQDFYSHSNWVHTDWASKGYGRVPTWFDVPTEVRRRAGVWTDGPGKAPHGSWRNAGGLAKDWPGKVLYDEAHMAAYFATRQWVRAVRSWIGNDSFWAQAQKYPGSSRLAKDVAGSVGISLYAGRWQGQGSPCHPTKGCDEYSGPGGDLLSLRRATNTFFEGGPSVYRYSFERLAPRMAVQTPPGELHPVAPSTDIQRQTRFVKLEVVNMRGIALGDPGSNQADLYARASILGQDYLSAVIHGRDSFTFPSPHRPFKWLRAVPRSYTGGEPVADIVVRVRTSSSLGAGTDDDVYLRLGPGLRFPLDKRLYNDFERGDDDVYSLPIDAATRAGLKVGDIKQVTLEKGPDGAGGAWKLRGVTLTVNGRVVYSKDGIERWLEKDRRTWTAPDFQARSPTGRAVPVWLDLWDDDYSDPSVAALAGYALAGPLGAAAGYAGVALNRDDRGDINPLGFRWAIALGYVPEPAHPPLERTVTGGSLHAGRLKDEGTASLRYRLTTLDPEPMPPPPTVTSLQPASGPTTGGTQVVVTGTNFFLTGAAGRLTTVRFGPTEAVSVAVESTTRLRAFSPPRPAGTVHVTVTTPSGTSAATDASRFTYEAPPPPPRPSPPPPTVINFDNLSTGAPQSPPGGLATVNSQYAGQGVTFNDLKAIDYAKSPGAIPGFAHSGTVAVESCVGVEFCTTPIRGTFNTPQQRVKVWVGFSFPLASPVQIRLTAYGGSSVVGTAQVGLAPQGVPTSIEFPLEVRIGSNAIARFEVSIPGGYNNALAVDDVEFERAPSSLAAVHERWPPVSALALLAVGGIAGLAATAATRRSRGWQVRRGPRKSVSA